MATIVSVVMPVYNGEKHLKSAIESILQQTLQDFQFIIIDDGSTDRTSQIVACCAENDQRITIIRNPRNLGITASLNIGLGVATGQYIARMDADDISMQHRLEAQVAYLEAFPDIGLLGTNISYIDADGQPLNAGKPKHRLPETPEFVRWSLLWRCALYHPTIMLRRQVLEETGYVYDENFEYAEDYDLWTRLMHHTSVYRLPEALVRMRVLSSSISRKHNEEQRTHVTRIRRRAISSYLNVVPSEAGLDTLSKVFSYDTVVDGDFQMASDILALMYQRFLDRHPSTLAKSEVLSDIANRQARIAYVASNSGQAYLSLALFARIGSFSIRKLLSRPTFANGWYAFWAAFKSIKRSTNGERG